MGVRNRHLVNGFVTLFLFSLVNAPALAWGPEGHEQVADIAWVKLTPTAKSRVAAILRKGDPNFRLNSNSESDARRAFRRSANFPDVIKNRFSTIYEPLISSMNARFWTNRNPPPKSRDGEAVRCKSWHFFDTPLDVSSGVQVHKRSSSLLKSLPDAERQLSRLATAQTDIELQAWWLAWLVHLVGDAHQPLHCAESYASGKGDGGGNLFKLGFQRHRKLVSLHSLWDGGITNAIEDFEDENAATEEVTAAWITTQEAQPTLQQLQDRDVASWVRAHAKIAKEQVYPGIQRGAPSVSDSYRANESKICRKQAVLAGYRLAIILNEIFS